LRERPRKTECRGGARESAKWPEIKFHHPHVRRRGAEDFDCSCSGGQSARTHGIHGPEAKGAGRERNRGYTEGDEDNKGEKNSAGISAAEEYDAEGKHCLRYLKAEISRRGKEDLESLRAAEKALLLKCCQGQVRR